MSNEDSSFRDPKFLFSDNPAQLFNNIPNVAPEFLPIQSPVGSNFPFTTTVSLTQQAQADVATYMLTEKILNMAELSSDFSDTFTSSIFTPAASTQQAPQAVSHGNVLITGSVKATCEEITHNARLIKEIINESVVDLPLSPHENLKIAAEEASGSPSS